MEDIIKFYQELPKHGLYENKLKTLESFIPYFKEQTKDIPDLICLKKKLDLEKKNKTDTIEYKIILDKIKQIGVDYKNKGDKFEKDSFLVIEEYVNKFVKDNNIKGKLKIHKNKTLFEERNKEWNVIGEVDIIVVITNNDINYILFIGEIKHNFDDLPDAFYQINRSYQLLKNMKNNVRLNNTVFDESYILYFDNVYESSLITSHFDPKNNKYFDIQSKLKFMILMMIGLYNIKPKKIMKRVIKKQKNERYKHNVLYIINTFQKFNLINRIIFL